jgi:hypothetical protein
MVVIGSYMLKSQRETGENRPVEKSGKMPDGDRIRA